MVGLCPHCDQYAYFNEINDLLHCSNCSNQLPQEYKSHFFDISLQVTIGGQQLTVEPILITITNKSFNTSNLSNYFNINGLSESFYKSFEKELNDIKKMSRRDNIPIPVVLIISSTDRKYEFAVGLRVNPNGQIVAPISHKLTSDASNKFSYYDYLKSPEWKSKRAPVLKNATYRCQVCNSTKRLEVHHRTYERLGSELESDLTVLCHNCHNLFSTHGKLRTKD